MNKISDIISFISQFKSMKYNFGEIWYSQIDNHFVCKIDKYFYDINGQIDFNEYENLQYFKKYIENNPLDSIRLYRDCIAYITDKDLTLGEALLFFNKI